MNTDILSMSIATVNEIVLARIYGQSPDLTSWLLNNDGYHCELKLEYARCPKTLGVDGKIKVVIRTLQYPELEMVDRGKILLYLRGDMSERDENMVALCAHNATEAKAIADIVEHAVRECVGVYKTKREQVTPLFDTLSHQHQVNLCL